MHEMSLCENVLQIIQTESQRQHFSTVKTVWLEIGSLSCVEPDAMLFNFEMVCRDTLADGASLKIIRTLGTAWCSKCLKEVPVQQRFDECPTCHTHQLQIIQGDEMKIKELEVE